MSVVPFCNSRSAWLQARGGRQSRDCLCAAAAGAASFRPCIDIHQGKVKQIVGSTLKDLDPSGGAAELQTNFESALTSSFYANLYRLSGLEGGHVIMLGADHASRCAAYEALLSYPGGLQLGGGVTDSNAASFIDAGASHVIVTSHVFNAGRLDEARLQELVKLVGRQRLVLDLSCRWRDGSYWIVTDRWQRFTEVSVDAPTLAKLAASCAEFLVHGVDVEGKQLGIDEQLVSLLGQHSPIPVTYAGGVASLEDLTLVESAGAGHVDVTVGSALDIFGGNLAFNDVLSWHRKH